MILFIQDILNIILEFSLIQDIISLLLLNKFIYENNKKIITTSWFKEKQISYYFSLDIINFLGGIDNLVNIPFYYLDYFKVLNNSKKCPNIFLGGNNKTSYLIIKIRKNNKIITTILFKSLVEKSNNWFVRNLSQFCSDPTKLVNPYINSFGNFNPSYYGNSILKYNLQTILNKIKNSINNHNNVSLKYYDHNNLKIKLDKIYI